MIWLLVPELIFPRIGANHVQYSAYSGKAPEVHQVSEDQLILTGH